MPTCQNQSEWLCHLQPLSDGLNSPDQVLAALLQYVLGGGVPLLGTGNHEGGQSSNARPAWLSIHPPANKWRPLLILYQLKV